jgi:SDR family mycofactocin-dependent oxidoreductase
MTGRLEGKVALVTGAARGQGRSHCVRLAEEGADIIAVDICQQIDTVTSYQMGTAEDLEETVALVEKLDRRIVARQADVRDLSALTEAVNDGVAELGRLDIVVANAGIVGYGKTWEFTEDQWRDVLDVNLTGVWNTTKATIPILIEAGRGGSMVFISSLAGTKGFANVGHYATTKHGMIGLMRTLSAELGPYFIRVNTVNPTCVDTPMIMHPDSYKLFVPDADEPTMEQVGAAMGSMNSIPIPWLEPVDTSNAIVFLASDEARYISGVDLPVDAGARVK